MPPAARRGVADADDSGRAALGTGDLSQRCLNIALRPSAQESQGGPGGPRVQFDGAPDLEFRSATDALQLEKSGLCYQRVPPGYRFPYGHTHKKQKEVYVVAVRVAPGAWRGYEAGAGGLEILVIGAPNLGEAPREDVDGQRDLVG